MEAVRQIPTIFENANNSVTEAVRQIPTIFENANNSATEAVRQVWTFSRADSYENFNREYLGNEGH